MQFANASKQGDVMTVFMHVWPDKNIADVDQADMMFRFVDGVSDDQTTNALFSYMSRYVDAQEALKLNEGRAIDDSKAIVTNSFWENWYVQMGADMTLLNPYGANFVHVFPNGKSFGLDVALGKWFTPVFGVRGRVNLENAFFQSDHAKWLKGCEDGFLTLVEDFQFNLLNIFGKEKLNRKYTLIAYTRAGAFIICRNGKGSPILGLGISNVFRLSDKWSLYGDVVYNAVTQVIGFSTGVGNGSNGYFDISIGAQLRFSSGV